MTSPLDGIRVVDLTSVIMGPFATQILGDLGADVVTVEEPGGALNRVMSPGPHPQLSGIALNLLRNKRSVVMDVKSSAGQAALLKLIATADVLVTNLRPGTLTRLGLAYEDVAVIRPDIVYCQAQGWPSDTPQADAPAYDDIIQAATGLPDAFVRSTGTAMFAPTILADKVCGMTIAYAVLAALLHREKTGKGQRVEVPMVDVMTAFVLVEHAAAYAAVPAQGSAGYARILNPERRPQTTKDGYVSMLPYSKKNYQDIFEAGGRDDLLDDERIQSARARIANAESLYRDVAAVAASRSTAEWLDFCGERNIPVTAVRTLEELIDGLPQESHPVAGPYHATPQPVRFSASPSRSVARPAALSGQHTREVLTELGVAEDVITEILRSAGRGRHVREAARAQEVQR
jgi:crotonobetainyl-CoA:carnitine CoA-transferase CaiB-like acyl-CoA transferase